MAVCEVCVGRAGEKEGGWMGENSMYIGMYLGR